MSSSTTTPPDELPEEVVASPAVEGDLHEEMRRAATPFSRATLILAGLVVIAAAFAGGAWTHSAFGSTTSSGTPARQASAPSGTAQAGASGAQGGRAGRGTTGTVDRVDGTTVYVKTAQGDEVAVSTSDSTTVGVTTAGKLADLKPGASVTVQGQTGEDGKVQATAITAQPAR
jgi:hypothetical protein